MVYTLSLVAVPTYCEEVQPIRCPQHVPLRRAWRLSSGLASEATQARAITGSVCSSLSTANAEMTPPSFFQPGLGLGGPSVSRCPKTSSCGLDATQSDHDVSAYEDHVSSKGQTREQQAKEQERRKRLRLSELCMRGDAGAGEQSRRQRRGLVCGNTGIAPSNDKPPSSPQKPTSVNVSP